MKSRQVVDSFLGAGLILASFYLINLFVVNIFALNFSTDGVNYTVVLILFLIGSSVFLIFPKPVSPFSLKIAWVIFGLSSALVAVPNSIITVLMCGVGFVAVIPLLITFTKKYSFALASSVYITVFTLFDGVNIFGSIFGQIFYICFILILVALGIVFDILQKNEHVQTDRYLRIYPLIFLSVLFLAAPHAISTWTYPGLYNWLAFLSHTTYTYLLRILSLIAIFAGMLIGEKQIFNTVQMDEKETKGEKVENVHSHDGEDKLKHAYILAFSLLFLVAMLDLIFLHVLPLLTFPAALFASVLLSFTGIKANPSRGFWLKLLGIQFIVLLLLLFHLLAGNWRFAPSYLHTIIRGLAGVYLYMLSIVFVAIQLIWRVKNE